MSIIYAYIDIYYIYVYNISASTIGRPVDLATYRVNIIYIDALRRRALSLCDEFRIRHEQVCRLQDGEKFSERPSNQSKMATWKWKPVTSEAAGRQRGAGVGAETRDTWEYELSGAANLENLALIRTPLAVGRN